MISLVVAMAHHNVIGLDNGLPWGRLPEDLKHFKSVTLGKPVLMGRKTFDSIGKPLPGRTNFVLTRDRSWKAEGVVVVHDIQDALAADNVSGIGGAEIYRLLLPLADRIYLTRIDTEVSGDTVFPPIDPAEWVETESRAFNADERNAYNMTFVTLDRARATAR